MRIFLFYSKVTVNSTEEICTNLKLYDLQKFKALKTSLGEFRIESALWPRVRAGVVAPLLSSMSGSLSATAIIESIGYGRTGSDDDPNECL